MTWNVALSSRITAADVPMLTLWKLSRICLLELMLSAQLPGMTRPAAWRSGAEGDVPILPHRWSVYWQDATRPQAVTDGTL
eukprot:scaffold168_cov410-Prasinococcus_capsulatus_cf.AAC.1